MGWQALVPVGDGQAEWVNVLDVRMVCEGVFGGTFGVSVQLEDGVAEGEVARVGQEVGWTDEQRELVKFGQSLAYWRGYEDGEQGAAVAGQEGRQAGE